MRSELLVDFKFRFGWRAVDQGRIFLGGLLGAEQVGQLNQDRFILRQKNDATGFKIKPVGVHQIVELAFSCPGLLFRDAGMQQLHQVRPQRIVTIGRGQKSGRFIDCQEVFVFKQNRDFPELAGGR